jgi:serpin B
MNKKLFTFGIGLLLIAAATAIGILFLYPYEPQQPPRADDSGWTEQGVREVVDANNKFALQLYGELSKADGNIFYSPYSISSALAMTYEGAKGKTADEIKSVFHFPENSILRPNFAAIYNSINEGAKDYELRTGNALWVQYDYPLLDDYTERVERYYGGRAANLDFVNEQEKSRETINNFIEEQTNNKIKELIPEGVINEMTRLILTNAIYFKGTWEWEFDKSKTRQENFKITPSNSVKVPMMYMKPKKAKFNYAETEELQILELPYKGDKISMLILLPKENLEALKPLTLEKLKRWKSQMRETKLDGIYLPKFEFDAKYFMNDVLSKLGMPTAFSGEADFSGMSGKKDLYISSVIHQAYVKVDEKGTEAAAATAVTVITAMPISKIFRADHPFIFIIQDKETGNILFMGRVVNPSK